MSKLIALIILLGGIMGEAYA